jgi:hypothetical protein
VASPPGGLSFRSRQRFHGFVHWRDLTQAGRSSIKAAYNQHRTQCLGKSGERTASERWELWSREDERVARLERWDADVDRQRRDKFLKVQLDAVERHQRLMQGALTVATVPVRVVLNRLSDPAFLANLGTQAAWALLRDACRAVQILPALINAERQSLNLSQLEVVVEDRRAERWFADRIVSDSHATHLAVELVNQVARSTPGENSSRPR